jgi:glycosyltransferase involved in cell wall biosynthesis
MPGPATSSSFETTRLGLITWDDRSPTGGNVYNAKLVEALRTCGVAAELVRVGAGWPDGSTVDRARLVAALENHPIALVDGIVAGNAPQEIAAATTAGRRVAVLVHLPLADEAGLPAERARTYLRRERATLAAAHAVVCPSRHAATTLAERYGRPDAVVAPPGVDPGPIASGSDPPRLLCLGAVTPTKNQLGLLAALRELADLEWTASIVGSTAVNPGYATEVRRQADALPDRVHLTGRLLGDALAETWAATDLLVSCSRVETYGLVVAEALARGIPAVVPAGTGAVEALGEVGGRHPGLAVDPGHPARLGDALRSWLTTPTLRGDWRELALRRRDALPTWHQTAATVRSALFPQ